MQETRRDFLKLIAVSGVATLGMNRVFAVPSLQKPRNGMVILFQGDSITDGNRGRNNDPNHIMGHGYAFSIASQLGANYPERQFVFYNRGISGNKVNDLAERWQADTIDLKPDVLSILVGINDASSIVLDRDVKITVEKFEEIYKSLLDRTQQSLPGVTFVLCEPFCLDVGRIKENPEAYRQDVIKRQAVVKKLAEEYDAVFVGFQQIFNEACKRAPADYWMWDGIHPTVAGHELIAREWLKKTRKYLL